MQFRVSSVSIVKHFDILKDSPLRLLVIEVSLAIYFFGFDALEKVLCHRIVPTVSFAAYASGN